MNVELTNERLARVARKTVYRLRTLLSLSSSHTKKTEDKVKSSQVKDRFIRHRGRVCRSLFTQAEEQACSIVKTTSAEIREPRG